MDILDLDPLLAHLSLQLGLKVRNI
jgi:hypothetical protein